MSYKRKRGLKITKFFSEDDFTKAKESCKRYQGLMETVGMKGLELHWSSIQRFDAMCVVPSEISRNVAPELGDEINRDMPYKTQTGEARITEIGNGMSRVQIPVFPM